ncbi:hypothetical protein M8J77_007257 [Diaphorina citri]|nr:hypothetical protein M8J77_007257 [Diaphorina citri]
MFHLMYHLLLSMNVILAWNLATLKLPQESILKDIAVHKARAFLVVPRLNRHQNVTLFEAPWPEFSNLTSYSSPKLFKPFPSFDSQIPGDCNALQSGVSLAMDLKAKFLFVLDTGSKKCPAKIIQYDVWFSSFVKQRVLDTIDNHHLNSLILDTHSDVLYISDAGDCSILVMKPTDLEYTRCYARYNEYIVPVLTLGACNGHLYMTSYDSDMLFTLSARDIQKRLSAASNMSSLTLQTRFLGYKLGISSGLYCDEPDGLLYYLIRDYAIVRWSLNTPLIAENHLVLVQSEQVIVESEHTSHSREPYLVLVHSEQVIVESEHTSDSREPYLVLVQSEQVIVESEHTSHSRESSSPGTI